MASASKKRRKSELEKPFQLQTTQSWKRQKKQGCGSFDPKLKVVCSEILESLMKHRHGRQFEKPVDPVALPDYLDVIWKPMDLGKVKSNLGEGFYSSPDSFAADVRRVFSNAFVYYPRGNYVRAAANHLSQVFETKWEEAMAKQGKKSRVFLQSQACYSHSGHSHSVTSISTKKGAYFVAASDTLVDHAIAAHKFSPAAKALQVDLLKVRFSEILSKANRKVQRLPDAPEHSKPIHRTKPRTRERDRLRPRESARLSILNMRKSVEFENTLQYLQQLEKLCGCDDPYLKVSLGLPLQSLGLHFKEDDELLEGQDEELFLSGEWEEGEIRC